MSCSDIFKVGVKGGVKGYEVPPKNDAGKLAVFVSLFMHVVLDCGSWTVMEYDRTSWQRIGP